MPNCKWIYPTARTEQVDGIHVRRSSLFLPVLRPILTLAVVFVLAIEIVLGLGLGLMFSLASD